MSSLFGNARSAIALAVLSALLAIATGCNSTPTVPVPPPEFCGITAPDEDAGTAVVSCEAGETDRNIALVFNDDLHRGVMQETNDAGAFSVEVEANAGDTILIQMKYDDRLSAEITEFVPAE
jgi:hypothetical protein